MVHVRICMFAPALSAWSLGGVAEHTYRLSKELAKLDCEVHVVCKSVKGKKLPQTIDGIEVHPLGSGNGPAWLFYLKKSKLEYLSKQWKFDLFHSQGPSAAFVETHEPLIVTLHGTSADEAKEVFRDLLDMPRLSIWGFRPYLVHALALPSTYLPSLLLRQTVKRAAKIIAVSEFVGRQARSILHVAPDRLEVVYNGAEIARSRVSVRKKGKAIILYVGYIGVRKGLPYLIYALPSVFKQNEDVNAVIVGDGSLRSLCQSIAKRLKISHRLSFTGKVTEEEKDNWYRKADLCVLPSTYDPSPIVAFEALAAGKPLVASEVGGLPEIVRNGENGLLVPPRDPSKIARAIDLVLSDRKLAAKMATNALRTIEKNYSWESIARKTMNVYRSCLGEVS
jgi:glycosyltransferase involved in cell wall biosynthesis